MIVKYPYIHLPNTPDRRLNMPARTCLLTRLLAALAFLALLVSASVASDAPQPDSTQASSNDFPQKLAAALLASSEHWAPGAADQVARTVCSAINQLNQHPSHQQLDATRISFRGRLFQRNVIRPDHHPIRSKGIRRMVRQQHVQDAIKYSHEKPVIRRLEKLLAA
ncbi:MAG: hypothetical protein JSU94_21965 [Phycisphaerales bacterium]|nr:MAG: hypothetical protein JSU94_21965 [Phycisphaerales bacterium]